MPMAFKNLCSSRTECPVFITRMVQIGTTPVKQPAPGGGSREGNTVSRYEFLKLKSNHTHTPLYSTPYTRDFCRFVLSFSPRDRTRDATGRDPADARRARAILLRARTPTRGTDPLWRPRDTDRDSPARGPSRARASSISGSERKSATIESERARHAQCFPFPGIFPGF